VRLLLFVHACVGFTRETRLLVEAHRATLREVVRRGGGTSIIIKLHIAP
jgi:hypothetical protein